MLIMQEVDCFRLFYRRPFDYSALYGKQPLLSFLQARKQVGWVITLFSLSNRTRAKSQNIAVYLELTLTYLLAFCILQTCLQQKKRRREPLRREHKEQLPMSSLCSINLKSRSSRKLSTWLTRIVMDLSTKRIFTIC